jgi:NADPH2:quinone reductase
MKAVEIVRPGGPEMLRVVERFDPQIHPGEALVRVAAAGVNRPDVMQRMGRYPPPQGTTDIPGLEISGTVVEVNDPSGTARVRAGDEVCALLAGGGYAELAAVPLPQCLPVPQNVSLIDAAAIPETFFTVWTNVFERGKLVKGETLLVHGGTSGIGTTAIQLGRAFGAHVLATCGSEEKCRAAEQLGADRAINYEADDFVERTKAATNMRGADVILDIIGGEYVARNIDALAMNGRVVQIGLIGGSRAQINLNPILQKRLTLTGSTLRSRTVEEKGAIARALEEHVWPLFASGTVKPMIDSRFPLEQAADAHRRIEEGNHIGKIVLIV